MPWWWWPCVFWVLSPSPSSLCPTFARVQLCSVLQSSSRGDRLTNHLLVPCTGRFSGEVLATPSYMELYMEGQGRHLWICHVLFLQRWLPWCSQDWPLYIFWVSAQDRELSTEWKRALPQHVRSLYNISCHQPLLQECKARGSSPVLPGDFIIAGAQYIFLGLWYWCRGYSGGSSQSTGCRSGKVRGAAGVFIPHLPGREDFSYSMGSRALSHHFGSSSIMTPNQECKPLAPAITPFASPWPPLPVSSSWRMQMARQRSRGEALGKGWLASCCFLHSFCRVLLKQGACRRRTGSTWRYIQASLVPLALFSITDVL